jgi:DHA3 family macrolide efflux protein-like MFS transporter
MASPTFTLGVRDVLKHTPVRRLWIAQLVSVFGDFLAIFAIFSVVTFELKGTALQVAMVLVAFLTPLAVISPLAGVYVDKWNLKATMIASDLLRALMVLVLVFVRDLNVIYATLFAMATVSAFFVPAQAVAIRSLAPPGGLMTVNALMTQAIQGAQILTPSITGVLVGLVGSQTCFILDVASFFVSAGLIATLTIERGAVATTAPARANSVLGALTEGMRFIFHHPAISFVMISMCCGMFGVRCFGSLLSVWVRDVLHSDAKLFGYLNTLIGVGMIIGSQMVRKLAVRIPAERLVSYALAGMGAAVAITAIFGEIFSAVAGMLALGFAAAFIMITSQTLMQHETPPEMLGRVSSTMMSLMAVSQVLAMLVGGPVAEWAGLRNLYYGSALLLAAVAGVGLWQLGRRIPVRA